VMTERSVLRLSGERADKKRAHWQAVAVAACEQCGRNQVPVVHEVQNFAAWLNVQPVATAAENANVNACYLLSLRPETQALGSQVGKSSAAATFLSGPEGGLSAPEEAAALTKGFQPVSLGNRVLRAETAGLAALAVFTA
jgi:16S rRNA (uracil1498-N3)-methyltransferase